MITAIVGIYNAMGCSLIKTIGDFLKHVSGVYNDAIFRSHNGKPLVLTCQDFKASTGGINQQGDEVYVFMGRRANT